MLDIPTYLFEGPYYKIRGIYDHSLATLEHVHFIPNPQGWTVPERGLAQSPSLVGD